MNGFGTSHFIDTSVMISVVATRDQALRFREDLRRLLRTWEDLHNLPHSFQTKAELGQREIDEMRRKP